MNSTTLVFSSYDGPTQGFTNNDVDRDGTKDPIVIRELIQNGLDAAKARGVKVSLRLVDVPLTDIPHIDAYQFAFHQARIYLQTDEPATGRHAIDRIQKALNSSKIPCLFCIDDGEGIDPEALRGLYSSGRSTKKISEGSRGSVGNGHLTAFAPSDLRYVLYAGLCTDGVATFGGHAILATHRIEAKSGVIEERSHHGYIRESRDQLALFADERGGDHIPSVMSRYLQNPRTGVSGSVVMITGYNPIFNSVADDELFLSSTAQHFTVAAFDESLTVDYAYSQEPPESLDRGSLQHWVQSIRINRDKRRTVRTLRTLETGEKLETDDIGAGVRVWFRRSIDPHEIDRPRVAIFRDGMWIKDNPSGLEPRVFSDVRPFDAVVDLNSNYEFGSLVKEAEGVSHLEINPREITDISQKKRLIRLIDNLRELLSDSAAPIGDIEDYEPPELKVFLAVDIVMKKIPPPQPKKSKKEEDLPVEPPETSPDSSEPSEPSSEPSEPSESRPGVEPRSKPPLRPGRTTGLSVSCRPYSNSGDRFLISWRTEGSVLPSGAAGLRLFVPSGTDRASANHVPARYLDMISITGIAPSSPPYCSPGSQEAVIIDPSGVAEITIDPRQAAELLRGQELGIVRAELVHRKPSRVSHE